MNTHRLNPTLRIITLMTFAGLSAVAADETATTIKFSDPSKPGTLKVNLGRGELRVQGAEASEVTVKSEAKAMTSKPRKDGMRVLSAASSFALSEKDNVVTLDAASHDWGKGSGDFRLTVPRNTSIVVQNGWGGDVTCSGIAGDIEINNMHGEIKLDDVSGGVVVGTMNGEIRASIRELHDGKPLSFTSMNGEVVLRLPTTAKANVRLRTQNGSVLTDFEETALVTKIEAAAYAPRGRTVSIKSSGGKVLTAEIQDAIREATQLSAIAVKEALEAVKEGLEAARLDADDARRQFEEAKREMEKARRESERERHEVERRASADNRGNRNSDWKPPAPAAAPKPAVAPMPAKPAMPTISGGKLVTGTLNGGGPEISVSTMNGDVVLRKLESK
jgi:hypothetical protein